MNTSNPLPETSASTNRTIREDIERLVNCYEISYIPHGRHVVLICGELIYVYPKDGFDSVCETIITDQDDYSEILLKVEVTDTPEGQQVVEEIEKLYETTFLK